MTDDPGGAAHEAVTPLAKAVLEVEAHAHDAGWDQPPRLYALVPTDELLEREPHLSAATGLDASTAAGSLTPVEQDELHVDSPLEDTLSRIMWPREVSGCAAVLERLALPPAAEEELPEDPSAAQDFAAKHPDRQEVRMAVGVSRDGGQHCVLRVRSHEEAVVQGTDLVPSLARLLHETLIE